MVPNAVESYAGPRLPPIVVSFLAILDRYAIKVGVSSRHASKTINLLYEGTRCGYIDGTVLRHGGVLGYSFFWTGRNNNACPPEIADRLAIVFCERYKCDLPDIVVHRGTGANENRTFLIIKDATLALRVLLQDTGRVLEESVELVRINDRYVEGAVRDVRMELHERSSAARRACLAHYGYDCFVCGVNLQKLYAGIPTQLIHVHHETPIAASSEQRVVDPIKDLKPVCPNCHAVIHSRTVPYTTEELRAMLRLKTWAMESTNQ